MAKLNFSSKSSKRSSISTSTIFTFFVQPSTETTSSKTMRVSSPSSVKKVTLSRSLRWQEKSPCTQTLSSSSTISSPRVIILSQQYISVAKLYRDQISWVVAFCFTDEEDMNVFSKKYLNRLPPEKREVLNFLSKESYAYIVVQLRPPRKKLIGSAHHNPKEV